MENEISVGDYIRTRGGNIRRVTKIYPHYENDLLMSDTSLIELDGKGEISTYKSRQLKEIIVKHSPNIIDLIEEGDYVNGKEVSVVDKVDDTYFIEWADGDMYKTDIVNDKFIQSIVTKEQVESISYKVK